MERDPWEIVRCCEALRDHCWRKGRKEEAREWHRLMSEHMALQLAAEKERDGVRNSDKFERHGLDPAALAQLEAIPGLRKAYFVKKRVRHMPERACCVLGFTLGGTQQLSQAQHGGDGDLHAADSASARAFALSLPGRRADGAQLARHCFCTVRTVSPRPLGAPW